MGRLFKDLLIQHKPFIGTFIQLPCPDMVEIFSYSGFDFVIIDNEHSCISTETTVNMLRAADASNIASLVRISELSETAVKKALDSGASGIMCPQVSSYEEAQRVVHYAKYYPEGYRGTCTGVRSNRFGQGGKEYFEQANRDTSVIIMIEGIKGIESFDQILSVKGIDGIMCGPADLSMSLGVPGEIYHPKALDAMKDMTKKAKEKGIAVGAYCRTPEDALMWLTLGVDFITYWMDGAIILDSATKIVNEIKSIKR